MVKKIGSELSEYEKWRLEKIKKNKALLDSLFPDLMETKENLKSSVTAKRKQRRVRVSLPYAPPTGPVIVRRNPGRNARRSSISYCPEGALIAQDDTEYAPELYDSGKLHFGRRRQRAPAEEVEIEIEGEDEEERIERLRLMSAPVHHVSDKVYDRVNGTTCHQCRQKTRDGKTKCNNKNCLGIRGQFCGVCLLNRYGEEIETVLKDPEWVCPGCKGYCNCSACLPKRGKAPTGILTPIVRAKGFASVKDFLASCEGDSTDDESIEKERGKENTQEGEKEGKEEEGREKDDEKEEEGGEMDEQTENDTALPSYMEGENKENVDPMEVDGENKDPAALIRGTFERSGGAPLLPIAI